MLIETFRRYLHAIFQDPLWESLDIQIHLFNIGSIFPKLGLLQDASESRLSLCRSATSGQAATRFTTGVLIIILKASFIFGGSLVQCRIAILIEGDDIWFDCTEQV
jgi:hypothetical protein